MPFAHEIHLAPSNTEGTNGQNQDNALDNYKGDFQFRDTMK